MKKVRFEKKKYTYLDSLRFSIISSPVCTILYLILSLAVAILPTYQVIINARFIDNALGLIDGSATKRAVYISLAIVIGIIAYQWLVEPIKAYLANKIEMDMRVSLKGAYVEKCSKIEFKYVENTDSMDLMNRVADTMEHKFIDGFTNVVNLISLFMTIAGLLIVLITQIAWVALIIIAVAIPLLYLSFISGKATYEANKEITKYQRKYKYLTTVMTGRENVDERTVFGYNEKLNDKWFEQYEISRKMETRTRAKWFVKLKSGSMITAFLCTFIAAMLINPVAMGIAAIDPIEETKIYKKFKEISDERTTVLVTHRLGSARIADRIVVMENGRVAEIGTHDELINKKGTYYVLFMSQAQWYENQNA